MKFYFIFGDYFYVMLLKELGAKNLFCCVAQRKSKHHMWLSLTY